MIGASRRPRWPWGLGLPTSDFDLAARALVLTGCMSLLVICVQARDVVHQLYRDSDTAVALVLPQLAGHLPRGTVIDQGNHTWYEAWWFMRATVGLPGHLKLWEAAPFVMAVVGIAAVAWSAVLALGWRAASYTAVVLLAIGNQMRQVLFEPDVRVGMLLHMGLLAGALLLVWSHAHDESLSRRWLIVGGIALAAFTAAGVTDQLTLLDGLIPFVVAPCIWWWRNGSRAARTVALFALTVGIASLVGGEILNKIMEDEGVGASLSLASFGFVPTVDLGTSIAQTIAAWTALGNGDFFGAAVNRESVETFALGVATLVTLVATVRLAWRSVAAWWIVRARARSARADPADGGPSLYVGYWGLALAIALVTNMITSVGPVGNFRYLIGAWTAAAALLGALVATRSGRIVLTAGVAAFAIVIAGQNIKDGVPPPGHYYPQSDVDEISRFVAANGARIGYAAYWDSNNFTWATDFATQVYPVWACPLRPGKLCQRQQADISAWFIPRSHTRTFLITGTGSLSLPAPAVNFGRPLATATFGRYTVRVYGHDLAAQILNY